MTNKKVYETKKYLHFDDRTGYKRVIDYVTNPKRVSEHGFFPLIYYITSIEKYNRDHKECREGCRPIKEKPREIMYASHVDNFIYKYYGDELNRHYNAWVEDNKIDDCSIAYRDNKSFKSNIDFAAEVINSICDMGSCFIMVGDFEKFFDLLSHSILKEAVMSVLGVEFLDKDWFNVLKSVTKFSYYEKDTLNKELGTDKEIKARRQLKYFETYKEFRAFKKKYKVERNKMSKGIPQGTAISAVLSNVYATSFDVMVSNLVSKYNGLYRRYSDDFIILIPKKDGQNIINQKKFLNIVEKINKYVEDCHLNIHKDKTQLFDFNNGNVIDIVKNAKSRIDYLGFVFDGQRVEMRSKSPYKFYRKAYKLISKARNVKAKKGLKKVPYRKKIYGLYTDKGIDKKPYGNFITYARNSQNIFDEVSPHTYNMMMQQIKNRKKKVEKRLGIKLNV